MGGGGVTAQITKWLRKGGGRPPSAASCNHKRKVDWLPFGDCFWIQILSSNYEKQEKFRACGAFLLLEMPVIRVPNEDGDFGLGLKGGVLRFLVRRFFVGDVIDKNSSAIESMDIELSKKSNESF